METIIPIPSLADLDTAARRFLEALGTRRIVAFYAPMGAGKTTFITALCRVLGVADTVASPTFTLVNEYITAAGESIYHFDFYRIKKMGEVYDLGYEEYVASDALCLMEWPELVEPLLPEETLRVHMDVLPSGARQLRFVIE